MRIDLGKHNEWMLDIILQSNIVINHFHIFLSFKKLIWDKKIMKIKQFLKLKTKIKLTRWQCQQSW